MTRGRRPGEATEPATPTRGRFVVVAVVLGAIGCFALIVGGHDLFAARGLGPRLFGASLAVAGLIMLAAASGVVWRTPWHVPLSLVGSFAALLVGVALLLAQLDQGQEGPRLLVWIAVIVSALVACVLSLRAGGAPEVSKAVRRVQIVTAGGIVLGIAQFTFTTVYGPTPSGPHLDVTSTLQRIGEKNGLVAVRARVTLKNSGQRSVVVIDSVYRISGARVEMERETKNQFLQQIKADAATASPGLNTADLSRGVTERAARLVQAGQVIDRGFWFEPDESTTREFMVYVPRRSYDLLSISAEFTVAEHKVVNLDSGPSYGPKPEWDNLGGQKYLVMKTRWQIHETSWVRRLVRGDNVLWSKWLLGGGPPLGYPVPSMIDYVDKSGGKYDPFDAETAPNRITTLDSEYGLFATYTHAELSLF